MAHLTLYLLLTALIPAFSQEVQKLGVYDYLTQESSPVIYNGKLLMLESIPTSYPDYSPAFSHCSAYLRVRDMHSLAVVVNITATCNQAFGAATVIKGSSPGQSDTLLVTSTQWDRRSAVPRAVGSGWSGPCAGPNPTNCTVNLFYSSSFDLSDASWESHSPGIPLPFGVYNTDPMPVPLAAGVPWKWIIALETTSETARFLASTAQDPTQVGAWEVLDATHTVGRHPDVGSCPSLRHDGTYFYYLTGGSNIQILRSTDLTAWQEANRSVITHSTPGDCVVAPSWFGPYTPQGVAAQRLATCGPTGNFGDDSDVDLVEWPEPFGVAGTGPGVLLEYGSGDQRSFGFSNLAFFNGTMNAFLASFF
jgi:hypothetical protein